MSCYVGKFKSGVKHGLGCSYFRNGDKYAGECFGFGIHEFSVYHFSNGHRHECSRNDGSKQSYGTDTLQNGDSNCGEQDSGSLNKSLPPLADAVLQANLGCKEGQLKMQFTFAESMKGLELPP